MDTLPSIKLDTFPTELVGDTYINRNLAHGLLFNHQIFPEAGQLRRSTAVMMFNVHVVAFVLLLGAVNAWPSLGGTRKMLGSK